MAMSLERPHAQLHGQGEGLLVVFSSLLTRWGLAPRRNVTEEAQSIRLVTPFLSLTGLCQYSLGEGVRRLQKAGQQLPLPRERPQSA